MISSSGFLRLGLLVWSTAVTPALATANQDKPAAPPALADNGAESIEKVAASAAAAFRDGQFELSLKRYQRAISLGAVREDEATLRMNIGACLIELERLEAAKTEFLKAVALDPSIATKARLSAALVAVELGQVTEAEKLLEVASPIDASLLPRAQDIKTRIAERRSASQREALLSLMTTAARDMTSHNWSNAETALLAARQKFDVAEPHERIDVLLSLGSVQLSLEHAKDARLTLTDAIQLAPKDPEIHYALGRALQALGEAAEARRELRVALELGLREPQAQGAKDRILMLDPLGPSEWFGWLSLGAGYDSNPRQSGVATETTLGRRGRGGSAYGRVAVEFGRLQRLSDTVSLRARYSGEWLGLEKRQVRELSLQNHGGFAGLHWATTEKLTLGLEIGPSVTYIGISPVTSFTWDFAASFQARYRASEVRTWKLSVDARKITGLSGWEFLGGTRLDGELSHTWRYRPLNFRLGLRGRHLTIGSRTSFVDASVMPACATLCDGADYFIPLSYSGFGPIASTRINVFSSLYVVGMTQLDWRRYRDESYIVGVAESRKRRQDLRWSAGLDVQWAVDEGEHLLIVPSYAILTSSSNIAQSTSDPAHAFDYDDRSFTQHFLELGLEGNF